MIGTYYFCSTVQFLFWLTKKIAIFQVAIQDRSRSQNSGKSGDGAGIKKILLRNTVYTVIFLHKNLPVKKTQLESSMI